MNSKYSSFASENQSTTSTSGSDSDNEYERDTQLKWTPNASFRGVLEAVHTGDNKWGQSIGIKFTDGKLVDGVLMERLGDDGEADGTVKLFPWEKMPVILGDDLTADDAPPVYTEEFGSKTFRYQLLAARIEGEEASDPEDAIDFGDFIMWEDGGKKPSSTAKVMAQVFTNLGRDAIVDRDDINNWLAINKVEAREDLIGRELEIFKVVKEGDQYNFHSPVVIDVRTEQQVRIGNGVKGAGTAAPAADPEPAQQEDEQEEAASEPAADTGDLVTDLPEPVSDFVEFCQDFGLTDEAQITSNLNEMAEEDGNALTTEMVEQVGEDNIVATILE